MNFPLRRGQLFHVSPINRLDQVVARRKVAIQGSAAHIRVFRDVIEAGVGTGPGERLLGHF